MPTRNVTKQDVIDFLLEYEEKHGVSPKLMDWKLKNQFPCGKDKILSLFGTYNTALEASGLKTYQYGERRYYKKEIIEDLKEAILTHKTRNFAKIRKGKLPPFHVFTNLFGSYHNAVQLTGITPKHLYLMNKYTDYKMEEPSKFIEEKIMGKGNSFKQEHLDLIEKGIKLTEQGIPPLRDVLGPKVSQHKIRKLFGTHTNYLIACNIDPSDKIKKTRLNNNNQECDSVGEVVLSNWLIKNKIPFEIHKKYPDSTYISDFLIDERTFVEYTNFQYINNEYIMTKYLNRLKEKEQIALKNGYNFIQVRDLTKKDKQEFKEALASNGHRISL